jgi:hypothetical protein
LGTCSRYTWPCYPTSTTITSRCAHDAPYATHIVSRGELNSKPHGTSFSRHLPIELPPPNLKFLVDTSLELVDVTLYKKIIGSSMYLMNTRPDICFVVNTLSQYLVEPRHVHLVAVNHVMRYLKSMLDYGLCYTGDHDFRLYGYSDSDWAGSDSYRNNTS